MSVGFRVAFALALAAAIVMLVAPVYASGETLVEANGTGALALVLVPLVVAALPLASPDRLRGRVAIAVGCLLVLTSLVSSAGIFFLPAGLALIVAWHLDRPRVERGVP